MEVSEAGSGGVSCGVEVLTIAQAEHLRAAKMHMDLLLQTRQVDEGVVHLASMLGHLRAIFETLPMSVGRS